MSADHKKTQLFSSPERRGAHLLGVDLVCLVQYNFNFLIMALQTIDDAAKLIGNIKLMKKNIVSAIDKGSGGQEGGRRIRRAGGG